MIFPSTGICMYRGKQGKCSELIVIPFLMMDGQHHTLRCLPAVWLKGYKLSGEKEPCQHYLHFCYFMISRLLYTTDRLKNVWALRALLTCPPPLGNLGHMSCNVKPWRDVQLACNKTIFIFRRAPKKCRKIWLRFAHLSLGEL